MEIKRILLPLDGSQWSEAVLPYAEQVAKGTEAQITLMAAIHNPASWAEFMVQIDSGREVDLAKSYLEHHRNELQDREAVEETRIAVVQGEPAQAILDYARVETADLIAMTTHGRSGLTRWAWGSVTDKVLHGTSIPLLLVRPTEPPTTSANIRKVLVPLDGSEPSKAALPMAGTLARALGASVVLYTVVSEPVLTYPGGIAQFDEKLRTDMEAAARTFLGDAAADLTGSGLDVDTVIDLGNPASGIVWAARREHVGLIVMSTHGRDGLERVVMGSIADAVVRRSAIPVVLVPPRQD